MDQSRAKELKRYKHAQLVNKLYKEPNITVPCILHPPLPGKDSDDTTKSTQEVTTIITNAESEDPVNRDNAMKSLEATVTMNIINIGSQGYPGVGKTSVLDLAMGKEPASTRTSTDCVDPPSRYLMIDSAAEGVEWENVTTDKMFQMVCEAMKKTIDENPSDTAESEIPKTMASQATSGTKYTYNDATPVANHRAPLANISNQIPLLSRVPFLHSSPFLSDSLVPDSSLDSCPGFSIESPYSVFPKLLKELSTSDSSGVIFNSHWMMVTDCGGQPPFLDAAALFLRNSCLQIFPVKLNEPLSKIPKFSYYLRGACASFDKDNVPLTYCQIIKTLTKSVACIQPPYTPLATVCPKRAKYTIVGTFKDKLHDCNETIEEKEALLKNVLEPCKPFRVQLNKQVILPVNAIAKTKKERTELAKKLRRLFKKSDVSMKVNMKLRWFGLLLNILTIAEKRHKSVLTLSECYQLGGTLGMDEAETNKAIHFFHDISQVMHFDAPKLRDFVIINTNAVLDKLSKIIKVSFLDEDFLANHLDIILPSEIKELLQHHGRFRKDTLKKCGIKFTKPITLQFFLDILEHVKIVVAIDKESEYFMPCALSYTPEASVSEPSPPWVIRLRVRQGDEDVYIPIPVGYLPAVIVFLLTEFSSHFSTDRHQRQYRNIIKLRYKRGGFVCLIERYLQLEIYFSCFGQLPQDCATIRDLVLESIRLTEEKLHIIQEGEGAITKVDTFLCSCGKGSAHHTCAYNPLSGMLECDETEEFCILNTQHLRWLAALVPPPRKKHKQGATSEESSHTNSASGSAQQKQSTAEDSSAESGALTTTLSQQVQATAETNNPKIQAGQTAAQLIGQVKKEPLVTSSEDVHSFESAKKVEELLSELDTVRFKYQKKDQQYIKIKDEYSALQEEVLILKADYEREKEELQQIVYLMTTRKDELFEALEQTEKTCNAKDVLISKLKSELMQVKRNLLSAFVGKPVQADYHAMAPDFLRGVGVFEETVLEVVGDKPQKLEWPGYGFFIEVPEGALPPGVTASVAVKVIAGGQFQFPENRQLISALYWIFSSELFLKDVAVNIQHCAVIKNEEQCSTLKFIIAKCSQDVLPYRFREREGVFNPHTQYGTIKCKQFSIFGVTASADKKIQHVARMLYKQQTASPLSVDFHFVVVTDLEPLHQKVKRDYQGWSLDSFSFKFTIDAAIELNQREEVVDPWKIVPLRSPPKITKDHVTSFQKGGSIPHCPFMLNLLPKKDFQRLIHEVKLKGVSDPDSFILRYPQPDDNLIKAVDSLVDIQPTPALATTQSQQEQATAESPIWNQPITDEAHLAKIATLINDWRAISPFLGLTDVDESAILGGAAQSVSAQTVAMLRRWKQKQGVKATYKQLREMFEECKRADLVEVVKQLVAGLSEETTHESVTQQEQQAAAEMSLEESPERSELMTAQENN